MTEQFPSQSHKSRESRVVEPVVTNPGRIREAPTGRRIRDTIFQGSARSVWTSMIWDTFFPNIRDNIQDTIHKGVDVLFGGYTDSRIHNRYRGNYRSSAISRHNPDRALGRTSESRQIEQKPRFDGDTSVIELDSRVEAQEVLNQMNLLIDQFDVCSMADFLRLVDITPEHTHYGIGWEELGDAHVVPARGSFYLALPEPIRLSNK